MNALTVLILPEWLAWMLLVLFALTGILEVMKLYSKHLDRKLYRLRHSDDEDAV